MPKMLWLRFELISRPEKIMIAIFTRYLRLKSIEQMDALTRNTQSSPLSLTPFNQDKNEEEKHPLFKKMIGRIKRQTKKDQDETQTDMHLHDTRSNLA